MKFEPEPYQTLGHDWIVERKRSALFAGMGLGKTSMTLMAANTLFSDAAIYGVLIIAPIRVINLTWPDEIAKWDEFSWMEYANLRTTKGRKALEEGSAHIYGINYEYLPTLCHNYLSRMGKLPFDMVVYDELTKAKNHDSFRINTFRKTCPDIPRRVGLTGSPMPNDKLDLFAQVRLLDDGERFGAGYHKFRGTYFYAVDQDQRKWVERDSDDRSIEKKLDDLVLVLKSEDYLNIPDVNLEDVELELPKEVRAFYKELEKQLYAVIKGEEFEVLNAAGMIMKLMQIAGGSIYHYTEEGVKSVVELHHVKLDALQTLYDANQAEGENMMVSYEFVHQEEQIRKRFPDALFFSDFKTPKAQSELSDLWNAGAVPMLVAHPGAIGHGLNLQHGGSRMVWYGFGYNRELFDQMNCRVARKGQTKVTTITRLIMKKTIEEAIVEALRQKGNNQNDLLNALKFFKEMKNAQ